MNITRTQPGVISERWLVYTVTAGIPREQQEHQQHCVVNFDHKWRFHMLQHAEIWL